MHNRHQDSHARNRAKAMRRHLTPSEVTLWRYLRRNQLGVRFRRQEPIGPYIADFVSLQRKLIVEADGLHHDNSHHDLRRDAYLRSLGYRTLRFENHDIAWYPEWVVHQIKQSLEELV